MEAHAKLQTEDDDRDWWVDSRGCAHHEKTGRFTTAVPRGWRRAPIVPEYPLREFANRWDRVKAELREGLVLVSQRAPLGARGSKLKVKRTETLDAIVMNVAGGKAVCNYYGNIFVLSCGKWPLSSGDMVEVRCNGVYDTGQPRNPRMVRIRVDLQ